MRSRTRAWVTSLCAGTAAFHGACAAQLGAPAVPDEVPYFQSNVAWVEDDRGAWFLADTGSPRTQIRPSVLGLADDAFVEAPPEGWSMSGLHDDGDATAFIVSDILPDRVRAAELYGDVSRVGGIVGADVLLREPITFDPQLARLLVGPGERDSLMYGVAAPSRVPMEVRGGGRTCLADAQCFEFGPTRALVGAAIDDVEGLALLDTAATYVRTTPTVFARSSDAHDAPSFVLDTNDGKSVTMARVREMRVGSAVVRDIPVLIDPDIDVELTRLQLETQREVELILGHSFLRHFATHVDPRRGQLELFPYLDQSDAVVNLVSAGMGLSDGEECFHVRALVRDGPAARVGIRLDDCITAVDGFSHGSVSAPTVDRHLYTLPAGSTAHVTLRRDSALPVELEVPIEDLFSEPAR